MATLAHPQTLTRPASSTPSESGLWSWLTTIDHKRIGILYGVSAIVFLFIGGTEALLIRLQLARPENDLLSLNTYNSVFTMHGTTMIFLAIMPASTAWFNYLVPLQIGARDVAFPRLNALSYWLLLAGALILNLSFLAGAAPNGGWYGYAPNTEILQGATNVFNSGRNIEFWALGLQVLGFSSLAASFNMIVTIFNLRAPGMTLMRMPIFTWATLITSILMVLAFPAITIALVLLQLDRFLGTHFYISSQYLPGADGNMVLTLTGGDPLLWQHLFWIFGHPEVYILVLPAFGIVSEIIPVFSRKPLFGYAVMVYALAAIAFLGFGVWVHHMFTTGLGPTPTAIFSATSMLIAIPTGVKIFNWVGTMWGGQIRFSTPMLFAVGLVSQFTVGGISGVMHASAPVDTQQNDSYFIVAHFHYVLFGGSIFALLGAVYFWFPKITGKMLDEKLGKIHFWWTFLAFNVAFFPMHFLGLEGMPRRYASYGVGSGWWFWNVVVSIGSFALAASFVLFVYNISKTLRSKETVGNDPWDAATLEWTIPSPPPVYNYKVIPTVTNRDQFWADKYGTGTHHDEESDVEVRIAGIKIGDFGTNDENPEDQAATRRQGNGTGSPEALGNIEEDEHIHMPNPSFYPLMVAIGIFLVAFGLIFSHPRLEIERLSLPILSLVGVLVMLVGIAGWSFEPASDPEPEIDDATPIGTSSAHA